MTQTPTWLPDGSGIDPDSLNGDTVVETLNGFRRARHAVGPIVRVFADVTPSRPDPRVEVVAQILDNHNVQDGDLFAEMILTALDAMGADQIRAALAGSDADTGEQETGHKCEPYYSRSECGQCGWQEQWCATCSRQMCGCATGATDQDAMGADQ